MPLDNKKKSLKLTANSLSCERDNRILFNDLNFTLDNHDVVRIVGPNGAGKTTLIRILVGLSASYEGALYWQDEPISSARYDFFENLLYMGHQPGVKANLTPEENLAWSCRGASNDEIRQGLAQVDLVGYEDTLASGLSAGQLRRIALARLHINPPPVWILDEPFTAIDKQGVKRLESVIMDHAKQGGLVILTTHHDLDFPVKHIELGGLK